MSQLASQPRSGTGALRRSSGEDPHAAWMAGVANERSRAAFTALFEHFAPRLKTFFLRQGVNDANAEELIQETMLSVWRRADSYNPQMGRVSTWLYTVARNVSIDRLRREGRPEVDFAEVEFEMESSEVTEASVGDANVGERLREAISTLPIEQSQVVGLFYFSSKSAAQIAAELGLPVGTVKSRLRLALNRLRASASEWNGGQEDV